MPKPTPLINSAMQDQLQRFRSQLPSKEKSSHSSSPKAAGNAGGKRRGDDQGSTSRDETPPTLTLKQWAAVAIATNLAESRVERWLAGEGGYVKGYEAYLLVLTKCLETLPELNQLDRQATEQADSLAGKQAATARDRLLDGQPGKDRGTSQAPPLHQHQNHDLSLRECLEPLLGLWQRIMARLPDKRQRYDRDVQKQWFMAELLLLLRRLRNHYSHMSKMEEETVHCLRGKSTFTDRLLWLYHEVATRLNVMEPGPIIAERQGECYLDERWGMAFVLGLLLRRSQSERLLQTLFHDPRHPVRRRTRRLFTMFSQPDHYSEAHFDTASGLCREMVGYLMLPPLPSAAGQQALQAWQALLEDEREKTSPLFRREDKVRAYLLRGLDELGLIPEMKFVGCYQCRPPAREPDGAEGEGEPEPERSWCYEGVKSVSGSHHPSQTKLQRPKQYGRNVGLGKDRRFVYDRTDPNLRFALTPKPQAGKTSATRYGVMRQRDFINLVFVALKNNQEKLSAVLGEMYNWLGCYQDGLDMDLPPADLLRDYPQQVRWQMQPDSRPTLAAQMQKSLEDRLAYVTRLLAQDKALPGEKFSHQLPRHEQVHQVLHYFIAHLNQAGRAKVTRREFVHLQRLLLQYRGKDTPASVRYFKAIVKKEKPDNVDAKSACAKGDFWHYLHEQYPPDLVTGNQTHPLWTFCVSQCKAEHGRRAQENIISLGNLCCSVLKAQEQALNEALKGLAQANDATLAQLRAQWQLGVPLERPEAVGTDPDGVSKTGVAAARKRAQRYSVIPNGFIQRCFKQRFKQPVIASNRENSEEEEERGKNWAKDNIRQSTCSLMLITSYYEPSERYPELAKALAASGKLSSLGPADKKCWKQAVRELNDWHTHDKMCLMMVEALAKQSNVILPEKVSVTEAFSQRPDTEVKTKGINGKAKRLFLQLTHSHQCTRQWFAWPAEKIYRLLGWLYPEGCTVDIKDIPEIIARLEGHYLTIVQAVLAFEQRFYNTYEAEGKNLKNERKEKKYVDFRTLMEKFASLNQIEKSQVEAVITLRNAVLHNQLPLDHLDRLLPSQREVDISDIGKAQLSLLNSWMAK